MSLEVTALALATGAKALGPLSFTLPHAGCWWLAGVSGAGKSLLMESLAGFHAEAQGRIRVSGKEVSHFAPERRSIALMPQRWRLFPHWTVSRNLRFAAHLSGAGHQTHRPTREAITGRALPRPPHPRPQRRRNSAHRPDTIPALTGKSPPARRTPLGHRRGPAIRCPRSLAGRVRSQPAHLPHSRTQIISCASNARDPEYRRGVSSPNQRNLPSTNRMKIA